MQFDKFFGEIGIKDRYSDDYKFFERYGMTDPFAPPEHLRSSRKMYRLALIFSRSEEEDMLRNAIDCFKRASKQYPKTPCLWGIAKAHFNLGELEQAVDELSTAIKYDSEFELLHRNRGVIYLESGRSEEAIKDFKSALKLEENIINLYLLGEAYLQNGNNSEAIKVFEGVINRIKNKDGKSKLDYEIASMAGEHLPKDSSNLQLLQIIKDEVNLLSETAGKSID